MRRRPRQRALRMLVAHRMFNLLVPGQKRACSLCTVKMKSRRAKNGAEVSTITRSTEFLGAKGDREDQDDERRGDGEKGRSTEGGGAVRSSGGRWRCGELGGSEGKRARDGCGAGHADGADGCDRCNRARADRGDRSDRRAARDGVGLRLDADVLVGSPALLVVSSAAAVLHVVRARQFGLICVDAPK